MTPDTKHFAFPFRFDGITGHAVENEQDTIDDVVDCIEVAFLVEPGYRVEITTFGVPSQVFELQPLNLEVLVQAATLWESRAEILMSQVADAQDILVDRITAVTSLRESVG